MRRATPRPDVLLVGGGLANGLIAYRLAQRRPDLSVVVLEAGPALGGNHTWCFNDSDVSPEAARWLDPFCVHRWPAYDVVFPRLSRRVPIGYRAVTSERFREVVGAALPGAVRLGAAVSEVGPDAVVLADGGRIAAGAVIDGRGGAATPHLTLAWQKFVGLELRFARPHGLDVPILMDATVAQEDGYRFLYCLPFGPDTALVEDTRYADGPALDEDALDAAIRRYCAARGWPIAAVLRREAGILPIVLDGDIDAFWREAGPVPRVGLRAALFHPTTGYSLPDAVRLADRIAGLADLSAPSLAAAIAEHGRAQWREQGFFRLLNRMLFRAGAPDERFRVLQRFYGLGEPLIRRFYAGRLTPLDKARILAGRPPVPLMGAVRALVSTHSPHEGDGQAA